MTDKTTTTTIPALLPCPFCGGKAEVHEEDGHNRYAAYWVGCNGCGCATDTDLRAGEAVSAWNRRAAPPPAPTAPSARFATPDNVVAELWRHLAVWGTADPLSAPPLWLYEAMDKALTLLPAAPPAAQPVAWMCEDLILPNDKPLFTQVREHAERRTEAMHEGKPAWRVTPLYAAAPGAQPTQDMTETAKRIADLEAEIEAWQMASGLCVPPEDQGGDPGGVKPSHLAAHLSELNARLAGYHDAATTFDGTAYSAALSAARASQPAGEVVEALSRLGLCWDAEYFPILDPDEEFGIAPENHYRVSIITGLEDTATGWGATFEEAARAALRSGEGR